MSTGAYRQIAGDERETLARFGQLAETASMEYRPVLTDFLDPRSQLIMETAAARAGVGYSFAGGFTGSERARGLLYPDYFQPQATDYDISVLEFHYPERFGALKHSDVLGALMNSGIKREVLGDIVGGDGVWQFATTGEMRDFIRLNLTRVGNKRIELAEATRPLAVVQPWQAREIIVNGMRLDAVVAGVFKLSRAQARELVQGRMVQLNWREDDRSDAAVGVGDQISVRGYGRIKIDTMLGVTAKDKWRLATEYIDRKSTK